MRSKSAMRGLLCYRKRLFSMNFSLFGLQQIRNFKIDKLQSKSENLVMYGAFIGAVGNAV